METSLSKTSIFASKVCDRSYYIRLSDNSLVMIDMGCMNLAAPKIPFGQLFKDYTEELKQVCKSDIIRVRGLILTHPHDDHTNFLEKLKATGLDENFVIEKVIRHFPPKDWKPKNNWENPNYPETIENILQNMQGTEIITAKRGMKFNFDNSEFEILLDPDESPGGPDGNYFSLLIKQKTNGKTVLWTGDMPDSLSELALDLYGDELKCDILQVPHHGTPNCGVMKFFETCNASTHLWTISQKTFRSSEYPFAYGKFSTPTQIYDMPVKKVFCGEELIEITL